MNLSIIERKPDTALRPYIESFWTATFNLSDDGEFSQKVVPNGCIELIIHLSDQHCVLDEKYRPSPPVTLMGLYDQPYVVRFPARVTTFAIRFYPDGFRNILGIPPGEFLATYEDGTDVAGKELQAFCSRIREITRFDQKIALANEFFMHQWMKNRLDHDMTHLAMQLIRQRGGVIGFEELKENIPLSMRQLQRLFREQYGMKISDYIRLSRLNNVHRQLVSGSSSLTAVAHELGFTDQSHFIKEFRHFLGLPPNRFVKSREEFSLNVVRT